MPRRCNLIHSALTVSQRLGQVPPDVPAVPLQRDLEQQQKSLRIKPEALERTLELDLRNLTDLARSHLLHRLGLLGIAWGRLGGGRGSRGTFRETWVLRWEAELSIKLIEGQPLRLHRGQRRHRLYHRAVPDAGIAARAGSAGRSGAAGRPGGGGACRQRQLAVARGHHRRCAATH